MNLVEDLLFARSAALGKAGSVVLRLANNWVGAAQVMRGLGSSKQCFRSFALTTSVAVLSQSCGALTSAGRFPAIFLQWVSWTQRADITRPWHPVEEAQKERDET